MRAFVVSLMFLAGCAEAQTPPATDVPVPALKPMAAPSTQPTAAPSTKPMAAQSAVNTAAIPKTVPLNISPPISCSGIAEQGGLVMCRTAPNAKVKIGRTNDDFYFESADSDGNLLVGFDRDETRTFVEYAGDRISYTLTPREWDTSRIDGLPPSQVSTFTAAQLKRIRASSAKKKKGFASRSETMGFSDGFTLPLSDYIKTTNFGAQRILNGEPKKPHYGVDMAAPVGTPITAPADGVVSLADDDLYFEGAMVVIDHGQGLNSLYLHVNDILVEDGQRVKRGETIATVGSKGRSTGPHLCWRLKWRNRNLDPELLTKWTERAQTNR